VCKSAPFASYLPPSLSFVLPPLPLKLLFFANPPVAHLFFLPPQDLPPTLTPPTPPASQPKPHFLPPSQAPPGPLPAILRGAPHGVRRVGPPLRRHVRLVPPGQTGRFAVLSQECICHATHHGSARFTSSRPPGLKEEQSLMFPPSRIVLIEIFPFSQVDDRHRWGRSPALNVLSVRLRGGDAMMVLQFAPIPTWWASLGALPTVRMLTGFFWGAVCVRRFP